MWSDRLSTGSRQELLRQLRSILPAPCAHATDQLIELPDGADAVSVAAHLWEQPGFLWLDRPGQAWIAADPIVRISTRAGQSVVCGPNGYLEVDARGFDLLEAAMEAWRGPAAAMFGGYLGYELGAELENLTLPEHQVADLPDLQLGLYDWRYEHSTSGWRVRGTDAWREFAARPLPNSRGAATLGPVSEPRPKGAVVSLPDAEGFQAAVARTVDRIRNGELFQVNLCRRLETRVNASEILPFYLRLRKISPATHGAFFRTGSDSAILSVSPELFLEVRGRHVRSCPIKGTRPRGESPGEDRILAAELAASEKDRAELAMIVDVTRNDLGRVCRAGSVRVTRHAELVSLPTVHHTFSEVTGELRDGCGPVDLLRACFPPASITGAPKIRAMELAALEEGRRRGACMGSIGWMSLDGGLELSVAIRTAVASGGRAWYLAGCGITAESQPQEELAESEAKAMAFLRALEASV
ncbi:MAG TPA: anthranilate synthase component I family protein [Bryobacteraceae bacterium]|nr:anthranilate synthase component I family protein [Bryobacteraceae bacterium]